MNIFETSRTRFISHRGFRPLAPENSLPSFYYAGLLGQWAIETDVRVTRDGALVCCHNATLEKYCNEDVAIEELNLYELARYPIVNGKRVDCFFAEELRIPTFADYLAICKRFGSVPFIELKTDDAERVIHAFRRYGFSDDEVVISSTVYKRLEESRACSPTAFLHWIFAEESGLDRLAILGNAGISWNFPNAWDCPMEKIDLAHSKGLKVCLRAADDLNTLLYMKQLGLDYFPTNTMQDRDQIAEKRNG